MKLGNRKADASDEEVYESVRPADDVEVPHMAAHCYLLLLKIFAFLQCSNVSLSRLLSLTRNYLSLAKPTADHKFEGMAPSGLPRNIFKTLLWVTLRPHIALVT